MFQSGGIIKGGLPIGVQLAIDSALVAYRMINSAEIILNKNQRYKLSCVMGIPPKCYRARHTQTLKQFIKNKRKGRK